MVNRLRRQTEWRRWAWCGLALAPATTLRADPPASDGYRLVFADEFNGTSLDTSKWSAASPSWTMPNSASTASASDVSVGNGVLTLSANRPTSAASFDSGSISSYGQYTFTGGYVEARIKLPITVGSWPAFWGLYNNWPPEADVMEYPLTTNGGTSGLLGTQYNTNFHYSNTNGTANAGAGVVSTGTNLAGTYHTFGMDWVTNTSVKFYLDGNYVNSFTGSSVSQMAYMYMILDYAVGGWPGTPSLTQWPVGHSDQTLVDWVRAWQTNPGADATSNWNVNGNGSFTTSGNWTVGVPKYGNETAYFGRVGTAATSTVSMGAWQLFGGVTFDGNSGGTTAYTLGGSTNQIQLASTTGSVTVQATAASTASQAISANVELWSNTNFRNDMTGGQTLNINGNLSGAGTLNVDGAGTVILAGSGSYTGTTTIGTNQGPAVLRVSADSAMGTGPVVIGTGGNTTTARLELIGVHSYPNTIDLRARNNNSVAIENISGNNTLSGMVSANVGGATYEIQCDAGLLTLSGASSSGVAFQASSGARVVTLQGGGTGQITGKIQDGGGTIGMTEAATGTWIFSGVDTYSGATNVSSGTLSVKGSITGTANLYIKQGSASITSTGAITTTGSSSIGQSSGDNAVLTVQGSLTVPSDLNIGDTSAIGLLNISTGTVNARTLYVGKTLTANGTVMQSGGIVSALAGGNDWRVGGNTSADSSAVGLYNLSGGSLSSGSCNLQVGAYGSGVLNQTGGLVTVGGALSVGRFSSGVGLYNISAGTLTTIAQPLLTVGEQGTGTLAVSGTATVNTQSIAIGYNGGTGKLNQSGGAVVATTAITLGQNSGGSGTYILSGGTLTTPTITRGSGTGIFDFNGGTILPTASSTSYLQGLSTALVQTGGAVFNTSGFNITVNQPLLHDATLTGTDGGLTKLGIGTLTIGGAETYNGNTTVSGGTLAFTPDTTSTVLVRLVGTINVSSAATLVAGATTLTSSARTLLVAQGTVSSAGTIDLGTGDLLVKSGDAGSLTQLILQGNRYGTGLISSAANNDTTHLTTLAVMQNSDGTHAIFNTFDMQSVTSADVLARYTYFGDTNLDGKVDGSDYSRIDSGYLLNSTGWYNGDFNYDGVINGSDYTLIDNAFNTQGAALTSLIANPNASTTSQIAGISAVPEPASLGLFSLGVASLCVRQRNRSIH